MPRPSHDTAATELALALALLVRRMRSTAPPAAHELSLTQMAVLRRLDTEGARTTADLARAEGMKPQSMGTAVAALEALGLVDRPPDPPAGRQARIGLPARGAPMRRTASDAKRTWLARAIAGLDAADRKHLPLLTALIARLAKS
jgi:DNA-binding MarR family transcriptional regulator